LRTTGDFSREQFNIVLQVLRG